MQGIKMTERPFPIVLAEALVLAEIRKMPDLEGAQLLMCDYRAEPAREMTAVLSPLLSVLGLDRFCTHTVSRQVLLNGMVGQIGHPADGKSLLSFSADCILYSIKEKGRFWRPFALNLTMHQPYSWVARVEPQDPDILRIYVEGLFYKRPVKKNAENPCVGLCAIQELLRP